MRAWLRSKEARISFLKKRNKKLLSWLSRLCGTTRFTPPCLRAQKFFTFFFRKKTCLILLLCAASPVSNQPTIEQVLQDSAADWSRGDLSAFMRCYENAPETAFVTGHGLLKGYDALSQHYAKAYGTGKAMGKLSLTVIEDRSLGTNYALVTGTFTLTREAADARGVFTLVFHHTASGWKIAYDHTS